MVVSGYGQCEEGGRIVLPPEEEFGLARDGCAEKCRHKSKCSFFVYNMESQLCELFQSCTKRHEISIKNSGSAIYELKSKHVADILRGFLGLLLEKLAVVYIAVCSTC